MTPEQLTQLSDALEEVVDSAELQDPELRKVAHADMLKLSIRIIEADMISFEFIMAMVEEATKGTKLSKMTGVDMEPEIKEMAARRGLMKKE